ncbi:LysR family transcriptional regulator substrate-binding protein, partial [Priestia megaterium]|uniref:LysR family transcriptional regulator substrate-binding protein n=1 Tax=Priestia megaterium TaxID=1404 RepID=UPI001379A342
VGHVANGSYVIFLAHLAGDVVAQIDRIYDLETVHLGWHETWVAYPPETRLDRDCEAMRWEDLPDLPMIVVQRGGVRVQVIEDMVRSIGRPTMPSLVLEHREARLAYVMRGLGGCFIEGPLIEEARRRGAVIARLEPPLRTPLGLVYSRSTVSPIAREFIATCVRVFDESDEESGGGTDRSSTDDQMLG